jgi:nitrogen regulatory protein P-II 2
MKTVPLKKITVVTEAVLEDHLVREFRDLGARGYTITEARGDGHRGVRASQVEGNNIRVEMIVSAEVADRILEHVAKQYFTYYAMIAYVQDVEVVRGDKYV